MQTVVETPAFLSDARSLGMGEVDRLFLLNVFAKNEKTDLTPKERRVLKAVLSDTAKAYRAARESR